MSSRILISFSPKFTEHAERELHRKNPRIESINRPAPGIFLVQTPLTYEEFIQPWLDHLPVYLHYARPVQAELHLPESLPNSDTEQIRHFLQKELYPALHGRAELYLEVGPRTPYHPRDFFLTPEYFQELIQATRKVRILNHHRRPPGSATVLFLYLLKVQNQTTLYAGLSQGRYRISPWPDGNPEFNRAVLNRAGYKMLELIASFQLTFRKNARALDLGAATGAWTRVLRQEGLQVTAVDVHRLEKFLMNDKHIDFKRTDAQTFLKQAQGPYELITNDMIMDPRDSALLMTDYAQHLRKGGLAILTLKLGQRDRDSVMHHSLRILRKSFRILRIRQLFYNKSEVTLLLRKSDDP